MSLLLPDHHVHKMFPPSHTDLTALLAQPSFPLCFPSPQGRVCGTTSPLLSSKRQNGRQTLPIYTTNRWGDRAAVVGAPER